LQRSKRGGIVVKEERNGRQSPIQPPGVKVYVSEPEDLGQRPLLLPKKEKTGGGREEDDKEEQDDVVYVTSFDEKLELVGKDLEHRRRGGVKVVPKLENSWPPEKKMENIVMESDVTKLAEETFEMETMAAGPKPDVQYGLTVGSTVQKGTATTEGVATAAVAPPRRRSSFQEMEVRKLMEVLSLLPKEPSLERYHELPIEEFEEVLLRGLGWERDRPIGRN
jgi:G patch domain/KOW motif-containing protein